MANDYRSNNQYTCPSRTFGLSVRHAAAFICSIILACEDPVTSAVASSTLHTTPPTGNAPAAKSRHNIDIEDGEAHLAAASRWKPEAASPLPLRPRRRLLQSSGETHMDYALASRGASIVSTSYWGGCSSRHGCRYASSVIDEDENNWYWSDQGCTGRATSSNPSWLEVDLGQPRLLDEIQVQSGSDMQYTVSVREHRSQGWTALYTHSCTWCTRGSNHGDSSSSFSFSLRTVRYLLMHITYASDGGGRGGCGWDCCYWAMNTNEIRALGPRPSVSPTTVTPTAIPTTSPTAILHEPNGTPQAANGAPQRRHHHRQPNGAPHNAPSTTEPWHPTGSPAVPPTTAPSTTEPSGTPTGSPTVPPQRAITTGNGTPTGSPTMPPTTAPPTGSPTAFPTISPTVSPTAAPTLGPTIPPTDSPTVPPTASPTLSPTTDFLPAWINLLAYGEYGDIDVGQSSFDASFARSPNLILRRLCSSCYATHQEVYYRRLTPMPTGFSLYSTVYHSWRSADNVLGRDFALYSTYVDARAATNAWTYCNYDASSIGFPRECGPSGAVRYQWNSNTFHYGWGGAQNWAFYVEAPGSASTSVPTSTAAPTPDWNVHVWVVPAQPQACWCPRGQCIEDSHGLSCAGINTGAPFGACTEPGRVVRQPQWGDDTCGDCSLRSAKCISLVEARTYPVCEGGYAAYSQVPCRGTPYDDLWGVTTSPTTVTPTSPTAVP
ncbi:hypothetical protein CYMTET_13676, partial [Cymbomonas tetramitiformis]